MLIQISDKNAKYLAARGMPKDILRARPFNADQHIITIDSKVEGIKTRRVPKKVQLAQLERFIEKPFAAPAVISIASFPNDGKAKLMAAFLMEVAHKAQVSGRFRSVRARQLPLWHRVMGGYYDQLRDGRSEERPSLLVLSNITHQSTPMKLEKLRDLLEMYNDIPRVIVSTNEDPITLANSKLLVPVNMAFYLATARRIEL